jgi:hypothetical protein
MRNAKALLISSARTTTACRWRTSTLGNTSPDPLLVADWLMPYIWSRNRLPGKSINKIYFLQSAKGLLDKENAVDSNPNFL